MNAQPGDGAAVVLHLIEAARAVAAKTSGLATLFDPEMTALVDWTDRLEKWLEREAPAEVAVGWEARTWGELIAGDTVSVGGQEAVVEWVQVQPWHVDPRSSEYRPVETEWSRTMIRLEGREPVYPMPTEGEVETLRGPAGRAVDEANGRHAGMVAADRVMVLASWAADAYETLQAAGLNPEPVVMTPEEKA